MLGRAFIVWFLLLAAAILNGTFRVVVLIPPIGDSAGHIVSTIMLCLEILLLSWLTIPWFQPVARAAR